MPDNNKTKEFLQKLAPCIERDDMEACVGEAARLAQNYKGRETNYHVCKSIIYIG
ncbi:MAG: hypothetical protein WC568_02310 [Candidatus Methanoperedens sp.]